MRRTNCVYKEEMERLPLSNPEGSLMAAQHLAEPHLRNLDATRNEKRNRNPSSITLSKAGISAMHLQLQRRNAKPNRFIYIIATMMVFVCDLYVISLLSAPYKSRTTFSILFVNLLFTFKIFVRVRTMYASYLQIKQIKQQIKAKIRTLKRRKLTQKRYLKQISLRLETTCSQLRYLYNVDIFITYSSGQLV
ncbi:Hypothetical_protein [Hexamita inflata]|uniref:Hypothetical_protein n=1 Tax=Hexamita inflata TaxID=28002 RepID=A0AA86QED2_9EUKA|nr:Hypothetical protein HINF_LOCUS42926 [Hexamita inflata]